MKHRAVPVLIALTLLGFTCGDRRPVIVNETDRPISVTSTWKDGTSSGGELPPSGRLSFLAEPPRYPEEVVISVSTGIAPAGPWFTHHLRMDPDIFDFEIGVPVMAPISAAGRVKAGQLPAATVARTVYHGTYEGLGSAWAEFNAWIAAEGHTPGPDLWEVYVAGPESNPDPATWRTELNRPLAR